MVHGEFHTVYRRACDRAHFGAVVVGMFNHPQRGSWGVKADDCPECGSSGGYDIDLSHLFDAVNKMVYAFWRSMLSSLVISISGFIFVIEFALESV